MKYTLFEDNVGAERLAKAQEADESLHKTHDSSKISPLQRSSEPRLLKYHPGSQY
jgi:hypothetical protein